MDTINLKKHIKLGKNYITSIRNIEKNFNITLKPIESVHINKIILGGSIGKKTLIKEECHVSIILDLITKKIPSDFETNVIKKLKTIIPDEFKFEVLKEAHLLYRYKYVEKFISEYPNLIRLIQILKIWNENRKIGLSETVLELIAIESLFRVKTDNPTEKENLKSCFQTLHNAMEGISIIPRNWEKYEVITAQVSNLGIKIVDPGDVSVNLGNKLTFEEDIQIRNESLRAISLISEENIEKLLNDN